MKWNKLIVLLGFCMLTSVSGWAQNEDVDDAIYISPEQAEKARAKAIEENRMARERAYAQRLERERYEDAYEYEDFDTDGNEISDDEIDSYNRRDKGKGKQDRYTSRKKERSIVKERTLKKRKQRKYRGIYSDRIARFHDPSTIVIKGVDRVEVYVDDEYYGSNYDNGYYYDDDTDINVYIITNSYYGSRGWNSFYPWYDSWWDYWTPWSYYGYYSPYYHRYRYWYNRGWNWRWNSFGYYPTPRDIWYDGYYQGYLDGYYGYGGRYGGSYYDPYVGHYKPRSNKYQQGRRSNDSYGAEYNEGRNQNSRNVSSSARSNDNVSIVRRNNTSNYERGTYWSNEANRVTDNDQNFNRRDYRGNSSVYNRSNRGNYSEGRNLSRPSSERETQRIETSPRDNSNNRSTSRRVERTNRGSYDYDRGSYDRGGSQQRINSSVKPIERNDNNRYNSRSYDNGATSRRSSSNSYENRRSNSSAGSSYESRSSSSSSRGSYDSGRSSSSGNSSGGGRRGR